jgi:hypothetical protein
VTVPRCPVLLIPLVVAAACKTGAVELPDAAPSPQASAEPAPLASILSATLNAGADAGPRPEALRTDRPLPVDAPHELLRDAGTREPTREAKELSGYSAQAVLRAGEGAPPSKSPELNIGALDAARRKTEARVAIDMSQSRARFVLSGGFVLPQGAELRARLDRYGHLLLWPGEGSYRVAQPGALRALLGERRLDVAPLSAATVAIDGPGARRLDMPTRRVDVSTRAAVAMLELSSIRDLGEGGVLVCRMLLDLMNAPPSTSACGLDEMPLHAELRWTTQGALTFDVISVVRRVDMSTLDLAVPPPSKTFESGPPPAPPGDALLSKADLASFRTAPVDVTPPPPRDAQPVPPDSGLLLSNATDELRVAWVDGVAIGWVAPGGRLWLTSLVRGRYVLQWRSFLGDTWESPRTIAVPGSSEVGP